MTKSPQLTFARLLDWVEGKLTEEEAAATAAAVAGADETTQATAAWLREFIQLSTNTVLASPPPETRELLMRRFEAYRQKREQPGLLQRLIAALTFDSGMQPATAGLRAAAAQAAPRQLIYSTDAAEIALNIQPRPFDQLLNVSGQIFTTRAAAPDTFSIQLLRDAVEVSLTTSDELGEFFLEGVPAGVYEMILSTAQVEITIKPIELSR
ncbi:MAG: hypothetical protein U0401_05645 [Anaerolineae bacterium]